MLIWLVKNSEPTQNDSGGVYRLLRMGTLSELLSSAGHEVIWWTSDFNHFNGKHRYSRDYRSKIKKNLSIQYLKSIGYSKKNSVSFMRFLDNIFLSKRFAKLIIQEKKLPDIIFASVPTAELAKECVKFGRKKNIPVVLDLRDLWPDVIYDILPFYLKPLCKILFKPYCNKMSWAFENSTAITSLTRSYLNWALGWTKFKKKRPLDCVFPMGYVNNPIAQHRINNAEKYWDNLGIYKKRKTLNVAFCGKLGKVFSGQPIIDTVRKINEYRIPINFIMCGDGDQLKGLLSQVKGLKNIIFTGRIDEAKIRILLKRSDIGLVPFIDSDNYKKNISNKPAEYLSAKLPIAYSLKEGELFNIIKSKDCGFTYDNNSNKLFKELVKLQKNPSYLKEMSKKAHITYKKLLDGNKIYNNLIRYLENISKKNY